MEPINIEERLYMEESGRGKNLEEKSMVSSWHIKSASRNSFVQNYETISLVREESQREKYWDQLSWQR